MHFHHFVSLFWSSIFTLTLTPPPQQSCLAPENSEAASKNGSRVVTQVSEKMAPAREDGADVEEGFEALARGVLSRPSTARPRSRAYRSKARRYEQELLRSRGAGKSCLGSLAGAAEEEGDVDDAMAKNKVLCDRILRLNAKNGLHAARQDASTSAKPPPPLPPKIGEGQSVGFQLCQSTGMTLRYLRWGSTSPSSADPAAILLHGVGEAAEAWAPIATKLAQHGFRALAPDLRGHGRSTKSSCGQYDPQSMVADLKDLVLELDLYRQPFALVGVDVGAAIATEFAAAFPKLVGVLACVDYNPLVSTSRLRHSKVQAAEAVGGEEEAAALLASPLLGDQRRTQAAAQRAVGVIFARDGSGELRPRGDPRFSFAATMASLGLSAASIQCPAVFMHSLTDEEASSLRQLNSRIETRRLQKSSGFGVSDSPLEVYTELKSWLGKAELFSTTTSARARTPESLGLRPLPEFSTLEEARKALGPRKIPDRRAVESELDRLRLEDEVSSSDEDDGSGNRLTALANNDAEYFGMVG